MPGEVLDTAYVEIKPKINDAAFSKIGDDVTKAIGPAAKTVDKSLGKAFDNAAKSASSASDKIGSALDRTVRTMGTFEKSFKKSAEAAADGLSGSLHPEIQKIEQDLRNLAGQKVGIDISAEDARKELQRLRGELADVAGKSTDLAVHVETSAAVKEIDNLDGAFKNAENAAKGSFGRIEDTATKTGGRISKVFSSTGAKVVAGLAAAGAADKAFEFIGGSISKASDLNETLSKTNVILGQEGAKAAEAFANSAAKSFGQSKQQALDAISTFATFGKGAGLAGKDLSDFSIKFDGLASDLSSFSNTTPQQAIDALGGALRGETEPIRAYGVLIDQAAVKAEAMSIGLVKATKDTTKIKSAQVAAIGAQQTYNKAVKDHGKDSFEALKAQAALGTAQDRLTKATAGTIPELTQQQKVLATQSLILKQTKDAQGDYARTSTGLANSQRTLGATFDNIQAKVGKAFLPVMVKVVNVLNQVTQGGPKTVAALAVIGTIVAAITVALVANTVAYVANGVAAAGAAVKAFFFGTAESASTVSIIANTVASVANKVAYVAWLAIMGAVRVASLAMTAVQWALNAALTANPIGLVVAAVAALVIGLVIAYKKSDKFRAIVDKVGKALKTAFVASLKAVQKAISFAIGFVQRMGDKLLFLLGPIGAIIFAFKHWDDIQKIVGKVFGAISGFIDKAAAKLVEFLKKVGQFVLGIVQFYVSIPGKIGAALATLAAVIGKAFSAALDKAKAVVKAGIDVVVNYFKNAPGNISANLSRLASIIGKAFSAPLTAAKNAVKSGIDNVVSLFKGLPSRLSSLAGALKTAGGKIFSSLVSGFGNVVGGAAGIARKIAQAVANLLNNAIPNSIGPIDLPDNPIKFARGGIVDRATRAIVGEDGREAIVPLTRKWSNRTMSVLDESGLLDRVDVQEQILQRLGLIDTHAKTGTAGAPGAAGAPGIVRDRRAKAREAVLSAVFGGSSAPRPVAGAAPRRTAATAPETDHKAMVKAFAEALKSLDLGGGSGDTFDLDFHLLPNGDPYVHAQQIAARIASAAGR